MLDAGCGNGKYLFYRSAVTKPTERPSKKGKGRAVVQLEGPPTLLPIGLDMSQGLLGIAAGKGAETIRGDCAELKMFRPGVVVCSFLVL